METTATTENTDREHADQGKTDAAGDPIVVLRNVGKSYGNIHALRGVDLEVRPGRVSCVLGDNGAGKSTLIKIISGLHQHTEGEYLVDGEPVRLSGPREALDRGIATVYQDLATVPLMPVWRNFFLGSEITRGPWPFRRLDIAGMKSVADRELRNMGIVLDDLEQPIGTLSGGQRQSVAIARAVYFGARVLILDEPTAALGVKQSGVVLKYIAAARERGLGVIFITHNPHHAYMVGDHFTVLRLGAVELSAPRKEITLEELTHHMAGGAELAALKHELAQVSGVDVEELPDEGAPPAGAPAARA
ncbi:ATP-binding cassette domain-containing protein [Streptomyces megasporus]|uniref:ATP-binding cassette domain-containing protein n=1 Tax=Streptomyces megasporus TaxID=44060 RepID=UPI000561B7BF|nr:ATP-binding cassette domain-containing protein [Streptomyces megasporus]